MTTEEKFFKAFGIELTCEKSCLDCPDFEASKNGIEWANRPCPNNCEFLSERNYPPITPEIVLKLEEILFVNRFHRVASLNTQYSLGNTFIYNWFLGGKRSIHFFANESCRKNSILKLFIKILKDEYVYVHPRNKDKLIQLKDKIQGQVKELFNE